MKVEILIKEIRLKKKLSLNKLSELSGISKSNIAKIERGEIEPKISTAFAIAKALAVDINEIFKYKN